MESDTKSKNIRSGSVAKVDCVICAEKVSHLKIIQCPFCKFDACESCIETFLLGIDDDRPRCMNNDCKKIWSYEFLTLKFKQSFHNKKYRDRRASLMYEREKSLLPGTQPLVAAEKAKEKNNREIFDLQDENIMLRELIKKNTRRVTELLVENRTGFVEKEKITKTFTRACPSEGCRGFLSTALKCGTCDKYACKDCHMPKNDKNDTEHVCCPDLVATIKLLANDTKPCPACTTPIFKIQGCDQMYCTQCHTAFSWERGTIERGIIHNPHYYEFQRERNGGIAPRVNIALRCGGPPDLWEVYDKLDQYYELDIDVNLIINAYRLINHINAVEIVKYPNTVGETDNSQLRVDYLMNRISEKQFVSKLKTKMKKQEKDSETHLVLAMFTTTMSDLFGNIVSCKKDDIYIHIATIHELREYTNNSLKKIGLSYGNIYPCLSDEFAFWSNSNYVSAKLKKKQALAERVENVMAEYD